MAFQARDMDMGAMLVFGSASRPLAIGHGAMQTGPPELLDAPPLHNTNADSTARSARKQRNTKRPE
eukprot:8815944-Alexandrium_andersonii.AAC.1